MAPASAGLRVSCWVDPLGWGLCEGGEWYTGDRVGVRSPLATHSHRNQTGSLGVA